MTKELEELSKLNLECPFCGSLSNLPWEHEDGCWIRMWSDQHEDYYTNGFSGEFDRDRALEHKFDRHSDAEMLAAYNTRHKRTCKIVSSMEMHDEYERYVVHTLWELSCGHKTITAGHGEKDPKPCSCTVCGAEVVDGD